MAALHSSSQLISPENTATPFIRLPVEIIRQITGYLPNSDIKSLRLTCRSLSKSTVMRLQRVFLSANPRNFTEIIWDDALLTGAKLHPQTEDEEQDGVSDVSSDNTSDSDSGCPRWFMSACENHLEEIEDAKREDVERPFYMWMARKIAALLPVEQSWEYYQRLVQQEREVLRSAAHVQALMPLNPFYNTPMIRALSEGFDYPDTTGKDWPGFRSIVDALTHNTAHKVTELCIDAHELETGLNIRLFEKPNQYYKSFKALLTHPTFRHLHIDLLVRRRWDHVNFAVVLQNGHLGTNIPEIPYDHREDCYVPLQKIFPLESLSPLQHFGLGRFFVNQDDLLTILAALPVSVRTIELGFLQFTQDRTHRPRITVNVSYLYWHPGRSVWIEKEVDRFMYHGGINPFLDDSSRLDPNLPPLGIGRYRDAFDPGFDRPHAGPGTLVRLGYHRRPNGWSEERITQYCRTLPGEVHVEA
ncbi:hypothetical protein JX265_009609 [Neoarthrinium moseri]|uniref:F-box domain-containing protein n=1 Tax=Neoarthrinium moseri TaxID=1658444 RepID=A0A9Q0AML7_9PEZI|nr:hypothetical protein JX265_009609 [Neoarthrinium moseri]